MEKSLFQKIKETQYFIGYLSTSILFVVLGAALTTKIGFPDIEAQLDYASFVIGLGTMTLFTYNLKGNEFVKVRDGSAKIAFLFLLIMTLIWYLMTLEKTTMEEDISLFRPVFPW